MNEGCVFKQIVKVVSDRNQKKPVVHYEKVKFQDIFDDIDITMRILPSAI